MTLAPGARLGPYEILSLLGRGGMGEVYRARDPRLDREVAVKVLPGDFLEGEERKQRFEREARLLAALNHPGIAAIHSFEEIPGSSPVLTMELVEGEDLAVRVASGPLSLEESLSHARQIAEALEAAHEKGVVHRDLKPQNVKVTPDGRVKLLDFGLAKAIEGDSGSGSAPSVTHSPTLTARATAAGVILGTAAYMSPEQARGKPVDKRTDVWAFGCVLFEMLTGRRAFDGETVTDVLAAVLTREPDWTALPEQVPGGVRRVLRKCLQRDVKLRLRDIGDARLDLDETAAPLSTSGQRGGRSLSSLLPWALAAAFAAAAGALALRTPAPQAAPLPALMASIVPPESWTFDFLSGPPTLSPDGTRLAYVASDGNRNMLCVRTLATGETTVLAGTEMGRNPFWTADGRSIVFMGQTTGLASVPAAGGAIEYVASSGPGRGGTVAKDGTMLYAPALLSSIFRINVERKGRTPVTTLDEARGETAHQWPWFLPDGKHFLFVVQRVDADTHRGVSELCVQALGETTRKVLVKAATRAIYVPGYLLYAWSGSLLAQPFDPVRLETTGEAAVVATDVQYLADGGAGIFAASDDGLLLYASGGTIGSSRLVVCDRSGKVLRTVAETGNYWTPRVSPDGRLVAAEVIDPVSSNRDVWTYDAVGAEPAVRRTFDPGEDYTPIFSPDGKRLAWAAFRKGAWAIYDRSLAGGDEERVLARSSRPDEAPAPFEAGFLMAGSKFLTAWSPDGSLIAFNGSTRETQDDMWFLGVPDGRPREVLRTPASERDTTFSPDGRWIAYQSSETGRQEVYVRSLAGAGGRWQVSVGGGLAPRWSRDGRELFFVTPAARVVTVAVKTGATFEKGPAQELFPIRSRRTNIPQYDPFPDGQRFVVNQVVTEKPTPLTLVQNWTAARKGRK